MNKTTNKEPPHILVVDDHSEIRELLQRFLEQHGLRVSCASDGKEMYRLLENYPFDLLVLDIMLPGDSGLTLCRDLRALNRENTESLPIIMLTAVCEETDRIIGLEMGADDYLTKPFNPRELLARIKAILRRSHTPIRALPADEVKFDRWTVDFQRRELINELGVRHSLSTAEFALLVVFLERPQRVLHREQLLNLARGREAIVFDRAIDTLVSRLRRKLEVDPKKPEIIKTIWGDGYLFSPSVQGMKS